MIVGAPLGAIAAASLAGLAAVYLGWPGALGRSSTWGIVRVVVAVAIRELAWGCVGTATSWLPVRVRVCER